MWGFSRLSGCLAKFQEVSGAFRGLQGLQGPPGAFRGGSRGLQGPPGPPGLQKAQKTLSNMLNEKCARRVPPKPRTWGEAEISRGMGWTRPPWRGGGGVGHAKGMSTLRLDASANIS